MRILLVDDQPENVESLARALRRAGHQIFQLSNPSEALALYKSVMFDVVISDVVMPGMSGIELLQEIRRFDPEACVILISGQVDAKTAMAAILFRAWSLLSKPINVSTMMDTLSTIESRFLVAAE